MPCIIFVPLFGDFICGFFLVLKDRKARLAFDQAGSTGEHVTLTYQQAFLSIRSHTY